MTTNDIRTISDEAADRLQAIILELEADRTIPLHRDVRAALYQAGTALAQLSTAIMLAERKVPVDIGADLDRAVRRGLTRKTRIPRKFLER